MARSTILSKRQVRQSIENSFQVADYIIKNPKASMKLPRKMHLVETKEKVPFDMVLRLNRNVVLVSSKSNGDLNKSISRINSNLRNILLHKGKVKR